MSPDTIKTVATYLIALVIIIGGGVLLVIPTQLDSTALLPFLTGAIGTVLGYVFGERVATTAAANAGTTTITAQPPSRVDVTAGEVRVDDTSLTGPTGGIG